MMRIKGPFQGWSLSVAIKMLHFCVIGRIVDGLPLVTSMEQQGDDVYAEYRKQVKHLLKKFTPLSPSPLPSWCTVAVTPNLHYHWLAEGGCCFLLCADSSYARLLAFSMLQDLQSKVIHRLFRYIYNLLVTSSTQRFLGMRSSPFLGRTH